VTEILEFTASQVAPNRGAVFEHQGIPADAALSDQVEDLYSGAQDKLLETAHPRGVLSEISEGEFAAVYVGEGENVARTPVGEIFERADYLALFAVTLGKETGLEIESRFEAQDFAFACMLDAAASAAAENTADLVERHFADGLAGKWSVPDGGVLRYSPGYCGWHVSGQRKLFESLKPERIGLSLRESFLMEPLKSVSGVIIAGPRGIHNFPVDYEFCSECETHSCRQRLRALYADRA
jgi:hypothetical protein